MARETAQTAVWWRGVKVTARMRDALRYAEELWRKSHKGMVIKPSQGSWSTGVAASAGSHDGAGACDLSTSHLTTDQRIALVRALKNAGLCAWYRTEAQGFDPHVHVLDKVKVGMAPLAKWQVDQFAAGRTGLSTNAKDPTYRPSPPRIWSYKLGKPI